MSACLRLLNSKHWGRRSPSHRTFSGRSAFRIRHTIPARHTCFQTRFLIAMPTLVGGYSSQARLERLYPEFDCNHQMEPSAHSSTVFSWNVNDPECSDSDSSCIRKRPALCGCCAPIVSRTLGGAPRFHWPSQSLLSSNRTVTRPRTWSCKLSFRLSH
ncbi:hypothetical protein DFH09DRAFT_1154240 [Mycena vulgaris]|nr:hypothetical protein DFH09DRAFT_1154240 [Mycena vulgaris]